MADDCDGITCCLYEYYASYVNDFPEKTFFAPLPIESEQIDLEKAKRIKDNDFNADELKNRKLNIFIGIQKNRSSVKGTDVMERVLDKLYNKYPDKFNILKAISIPYEEYKKMIEKADIILDQIYSYTPAMNALLAMAKGIVAVSGGEPENYKILKEREISPIINVLPDEDDIYEKLEAIILNPQEVGKLS